MKIAYFTYPAAFQNIGGGEVQLLKTREYVERAGQPVHLFDLWKDRVEDFDVLHIFSSVKDCLGLAEIARKRGVRVAVSPVLWSDLRRALHTDGGVRQKTDLLVRHLLKLGAPTFPSGRRRLLTTAQHLYPNSRAEKLQIARLFAVDPAHIHVVPNGVDRRFDMADPAAYRARYGTEPFVLGVGRIEPRKNQLNLIRALKGLGVRLVLIGDPVTGYEEYDRMCRQAGQDHVTFLPSIPHGDPLLASAYAACEAFVLQGWFETPGLAALEAALAGARLAVTSGGSTREYFDDLADYLDPADTASILRAVKAALGRPRDGRLRTHVREAYTWERVADRQIELYGRLLTEGRR
ncbi:MAG: D-inositol-3-phosphate glycosyltransferase [Candidatus Omnitrophica bacterium]|nr:D-inositol-3-phosphate glycosyltransferase [Candidatus Omnitrophota bacterium]